MRLRQTKKSLRSSINLSNGSISRSKIKNKPRNKHNKRKTQNRNSRNNNFSQLKNNYQNSNVMLGRKKHRNNRIVVDNNNYFDYNIKNKLKLLYKNELINLDKLNDNNKMIRNLKVEEYIDDKIKAYESRKTNLKVNLNKLYLNT